MSMILDTITRAILTSGKTRYRIAKESGVTEAQLSKLVHGTRGLSIETAECLAQALELEIIIRPAGRKPRRQSKR